MTIFNEMGNDKFVAWDKDQIHYQYVKKKFSDVSNVLLFPNL